METTTIILMSTTILGAAGTLLAIFRKNIRRIKCFGKECIDFKENTPPPSIPLTQSELGELHLEGVSKIDKVSLDRSRSIHISQV